LARPLNLGFDLHCHGVRRQPSQVGIRIRADKIAGVPIHAEPVVLHGLNDGHHLVDGSDDAAVVFQGEDHAVLGGIVAGFLDRFDAACPGFLFRVALVHVAGKNADRLGAEPRSVFHPVFDGLNFTPQLGGIGSAKVIADGRAADVQT